MAGHCPVGPRRLSGECSWCPTESFLLSNPLLWSRTCGALRKARSVLQKSFWSDSFVENCDQSCLNFTLISSFFERSSLTVLTVKDLREPLFLKNASTAQQANCGKFGLGSISLHFPLLCLWNAFISKINFFLCLFNWVTSQVQETDKLAGWEPGDCPHLFQPITYSTYGAPGTLLRALHWPTHLILRKKL